MIQYDQKCESSSKHQLLINHSAIWLSTLFYTFYFVFKKVKIADYDIQNLKYILLYIYALLTDSLCQTKRVKNIFKITYLWKFIIPVLKKLEDESDSYHQCISSFVSTCLSSPVSVFQFQTFLFKDLHWP